MKTEIYILSGFLGSGKTTLLKKLLEEEKRLNRKVAVMMNELGKVSIDSEAVDEDIPLKELLDGCICCTIQDKLESSLQSLLYDHQPEVIYIETTGAAHPIETLDAILSPLFATCFEVKGIISVVDGARWLHRQAYSPQVRQLLIEQVRHADLLLVNKAAELSDSDQLKVTTEIQGINQTGRILLTNYSKLPIEIVRNLTHSVKGEITKAHVINDLQLRSFVYTFEHPVRQTEFEQFLLSLPDTLYRMKGYIKFTHSQTPYLFQFSYGMPMYFKEDMNMPLNMVFIGEGLDWSRLETELRMLEGKVQ